MRIEEGTEGRIRVYAGTPGSEVLLAEFKNRNEADTWLARVERSHRADARSHACRADAASGHADHVAETRRKLRELREGDS